MHTTKPTRDPALPAIEPLAIHVERAAELMGVSRGHIYRLISAGDLKTIKSGARRLVPMASLRDWLERQCV